MTSSYHYRASLSVDRLRQVLEYNPQNGVFVWKVSLNARRAAGRKAGSIDSRGYRLIGIDGGSYFAHRLAFLWMTGLWPILDVDHVNGNITDNSWKNLREATDAINAQNQRRPRADNVSGFLGVRKKRGGFEAQITLDGRTRYVGRFKTADQAHAAYLIAKRKLHAGCTI